MKEILMGFAGGILSGCLFMLVYGLLIALVYVITSGKAPLKKSFSCAGCPNAATCQTACTANAEPTEAVKGDAQ